MIQKILRIQLLICLVSLGELIADEPPTPQSVAATVATYWTNQRFDELTSYVTNLVTTYPDYLPAILTASFHDYIFLGKLDDAAKKLQRVQQVVKADPTKFSTDFMTKMDEICATLKWEIALHARKGRTAEMLRSSASPQTVRTTWGTTLPPNIDVLAYAPAMNCPP